MKIFFMEMKTRPGYFYPKIIVEWFLFCKNKYLIDLHEFIEKKNPPHPDFILSFFRYHSNFIAKVEYEHKKPQWHPIGKGSYRMHHSW